MNTAGAAASLKARETSSPSGKRASKARVASTGDRLASSVQMGNLGEHGLARQAKRRAWVFGEVGEEPAPEQTQDVLKAPDPGDLVHRVAADQQSTSLAVDLRQNRLGGDNAFQSVQWVRHRLSPCPTRRHLEGFEDRNQD